MQVSVRELKDHLSKYLHEVKKGDNIIITAHKVPLARIVPITQSKDKNLQSLLQMECISWNGKKPSGKQNAPKLVYVLVSDYVTKGRKE